MGDLDFFAGERLFGDVLRLDVDVSRFDGDELRFGGVLSLFREEFLVEDTSCFDPDASLLAEASFFEGDESFFEGLLLLLLFFSAEDAWQ